MKWTSLFLFGALSLAALMAGLACGVCAHRKAADGKCIEKPGSGDDKQAAEKAREIAEAMKAATGPAEKKALLCKIAGAPCLAALDLATESLKDPALVEEAALAVVGIAPRLQASHPDAVKAAVQQVIGKAKNADTVKEADCILREVSKAGPVAAQAPSAPSPAARATGEPRFHWKATDDTLALMNQDAVVWQLNYAKTEAKPYFHPVALVDGTPLTFPKPSDHPWHRGLWFSWKTLNDVNYWEEDPKTGQTEGKTEVTGIEIGKNADYSAWIVMNLSYHPPDKPPVLTEKRTIFISPPKKETGYYIDWRSEFTAGKGDVHLAGGTAGGGYAGLSVRIAQDTKDWKIINSEGVEDVAVAGSDTAKNTHGKRARWTDFSFIDKAFGQTAGITLIDNPKNLRHPSEWHNIVAENIPFGFFCPAPLWSQPYDLPAGKVLDLRYRIIVHLGRPDAADIERRFRDFAAWPGVAPVPFPK